MLHGRRGLSGATITGNGRVALILDLPELIDAHARC
jgi:two-component system chemotaxis sensor kinase CheA